MRKPSRRSCSSPSGSPRRTRKSLGEAAEAAFLAHACRLGFSVAKPWGDSNRYDFLVDAGPAVWRVQVKSSQRYAEGRYRVKNAGSQDVPYTSAQIDFLAAYVVPLDLWYIIPVQATGSSKGLRFYPHGTRKHTPSKGRFEKYRQAWCLLAVPVQSRGRRDIPRRCRCPSLSTRCSLCPRRQ